MMRINENVEETKEKPTAFDRIFLEWYNPTILFLLDLYFFSLTINYVMSTIHSLTLMSLKDFILK